MKEGQPKLLTIPEGSEVTVIVNLPPKTHVKARDVTNKVTRRLRLQAPLLTTLREFRPDTHDPEKGIGVFALYSKKREEIAAEKYAAEKKNDTLEALLTYRENLPAEEDPELIENELGESYDKLDALANAHNEISAEVHQKFITANPIIQDSAKNITPDTKIGSIEITFGIKKPQSAA